MSKRKNIIRVGDHVKIVTPELFVRCGYPLTKQIVKDTLITEEQKQAIWKMLNEFGIKKQTIDDGTPLLDYTDALNADNKFSDILDIMAGNILREKKWGGRERKIYTKRQEELIGKEVVVWDKKVVKTGKYVPSWGGYDYYYGGYEYDPAYLSDEKTNVIYKISHPLDVDLVHTLEGLWIEKRCVEKINL